jgi:hypothetical protein
MSFSTKNYTEQGGEKTVIGGEIVLAAGATLSIDPEATIEGLPSAAFSPAASQADSAAVALEDLVTDFNSLLAKLRTAGLMSTE